MTIPVGDDSHHRRDPVHTGDMQADGEADDGDRSALVSDVDRRHRHDRDHHGLRGEDGDQRVARVAVGTELREHHADPSGSPARHCRLGRRGHLPEEHQRVRAQEGEGDASGNGQKDRCDEKGAGEHGQTGSPADELSRHAEVRAEHRTESPHPDHQRQRTRFALRFGQIRRREPCLQADRGADADQRQSEEQRDQQAPLRRRDQQGPAGSGGGPPAGRQGNPAAVAGSKVSQRQTDQRSAERACRGRQPSPRLMVRDLLGEQHADRRGDADTDGAADLHADQHRDCPSLNDCGLGQVGAWGRLAPRSGFRFGHGHP